MNLEQYKAQRSNLIKNAEKLIEDGKVEESEAKMNEIKDLDDKWDKIKTNSANLNALKENNNIEDFSKKTENPVGELKVENMVNEVKVDDKELYKNAWTKNMMGKKMTEDETTVFNDVNQKFNNEFTHTTSNTGVLIPEEVASGIFKRAEEGYALYADAKKFNVRGKLSIKKHERIVSGDAKWYQEGTDTEDEENEFGELNLDGHELSKSVTVSWKMRSMAVEDFIPFIIDELGERVGVALGAAANTGNGTSEPEGVITALEAETDTPQVITYDTDLTYDDLANAIAKVHSSYLNGAAIYASNNTIWTKLATMKDQSGRPLFIPDVTAGGVGRIFGMIVKPDGGTTKDNIVIGNAPTGLVFNTNEPFSVVTEDHAKARKTDYVAYGIEDGGVLDTQAFVLLKPTPVV